MPQDPESVSLPEPPPPRPAARDAAIDVAMRRFDGAGEPVRARPGQTPWTRRPQFQLAIAASLVLVVGLPAALIGLRQQEPTPASAPAPSTQDSLQFGSDQMARAVPAPRTPPVPGEAASAAAPQAAAPPSVAPPPQAAASRTVSTLDELPSRTRSEREVANEAGLPPPPPPPPPPPAAPMAAEKSSGDVVVTGSRMAQHEMTSPSAVTVIDSEEMAAKAAGSKDRAYASFLDRLQAAVRDNDPGAVTRLISYPLRVNSGGQSRTYPDATSVRRDYDSIFTPHVRQAILSQHAERLFMRDLGVMIGNGEVWFDHVCADESCYRLGPVRITAINR